MNSEIERIGEKIHHLLNDLKVQNEYKSK